MIIYQSNTNNPYFNIAAEEYFLKNFTEDVFYLYINEPSIIVGKHQNTIAEINVPYAAENDIKVVRRLSGGGTVFHDKGNLNYCFIRNGEEGHLVNFKKYSQPVIDTLKSLNVNAYLRGKSDLVINDLKFSGNAEHVFKKRVLHHGTLLFSSKLESLNEAIKADWRKFSDKAVRSNRSKVTNIAEHLKTNMRILEFEQMVISTVLAENRELQPYSLSEADKEAINKLVEEKYSTWKWNFAYSPKYEFKKEAYVQNGTLTVQMLVNNGYIEQVNFFLNGKAFLGANELHALLLKNPHDFNRIKNETAAFFKSNTELPFTQWEFLTSLF